MKFTKRDAKAHYKATLGRLEDLRLEYKGTEVPERITLKAEKVLTAVTAEEAISAGERAYQSMFVHMLALWGRGKIEGKDTPITIENRAKQAESLAKMLESKGLDAQAEKQRKRADELRHRKLTPELTPEPVPDKVVPTMKLKPGMQVWIESPKGRESVLVVSAKGRGVKVSRRVGGRSFSINRSQVTGVVHG